MTHAGAGQPNASRHLLTIEGMSREQILMLLGRARQFKSALDGTDRFPSPLAGRVVVNLFFENSTRTRTSFEMAARRLGAEVVNFDIPSSSVKKGETIEDTVETLGAMGPEVIIVRHSAAGVPALIARHVRGSVVNAGDGSHEHPTQALLDALTISEQFGRIDGVKVAMVGDILHSRVARSNLWCLGALGASITLVGPTSLVPDGLADVPWGGGRTARVCHDLAEGIRGADVVYLLRIQTERMKQAMFPSVGEYRRLYGMDSQRLSHAGPKAVVMHPGPFNRGIEISGELADSDRSLILRQVANGVPTRMAVLATLAEGARR